MKPAFFTYFLIISSFFLVSCQKNRNVPVSGNTEYLTQQAWKISKFERKINSGSYVDQFPAVPACSRDDEYKFETSFTYQITEGASKCNPSDPDIIFTGLWQLLQNETKLKLDNTEYSVNELNNTTLILANTTILAPDTTYDRITLIH